MKKLFFAIAALLLSLPTMAQIQRPKLVVGIVVDQMRWDYLYYYYDQFQSNGLRRLVDNGFNFQNCLIPYVPTVTAIGHSSIYTGSVPALTGIAGNDFYIDGKPMYCVQDDSVKSVGSNSKAGQMSPKNLQASGIGDVLKIATDYKAKVIGVALKDRAAILPAGHAADAAYWWDTSAGHFISSTYYMKDLPQWVKDVNKQVATKPGTDVKTSVPGVTKTFQMAEAALKNEKMGQDDITDLLAISVSSTDAIGHTYGTRGKENHDVYMELDKQLAHLFNTLDEYVGQGNYLVFLSADHGAIHNINVMKDHHVAAGGLELWKEIKPIEAQLENEFGVKPVIVREDVGRVYLNREGLNKAGKDLSQVKARVCQLLEQVPNMLYAVDYDKVLTTSIPQPIREMIVNGYNKKRSGDIFYVPRAGWGIDIPNTPDYHGTTHNEWNPYDSHIPFVMYGWHVGKGETSAAVHMTDIAPTVCAMLHIQMPNSCVGTSRSDLIPQP